MVFIGLTELIQQISGLIQHKDLEPLIANVQQNQIVHISVYDNVDIF